MSTLLAPQQTDTKAWKDTRIGRFTASTFWMLMTQPKSKAAREAGEWSETAKSLITAKAIERLTGTWIKTDDTSPMRRGLLMEPAALHILSQVWRHIDLCTWQPYGETLGSSPDGLVDNGTGTMDLKCPGNPADVVRFADEVVSGDFESLRSWDASYAWQIMVQALTCGVEECHLVYFTDRLPVFTMSDDLRNEAQTLIDERAEQYSQESPYPWSYSLNGSGYFWAAKSFTINADIREAILSTHALADAECARVMDRLRPLLCA